MSGRSRGAALLVAATVGLLLAPLAAADLADETALAQKFAPVVRLVEQPVECGPGAPYDPLDVDVLFGDPTVALRGPWNRTDLVKIGPKATDLGDRYEYHLDFPGDALNPGCDYERWSRRLSAGSKPTVYAHLARDPGYPGKLALQYWFFYAFNDFNNTHEGDWEMIQLVFDAADAREAVSQEPIKVGYSAHEGAEGADWGDEKLDTVGGTHPVVYPAAGSNANKFTQALYLGSSAEAGVGCDDTRGPHRELTPVVKTISSEPAAARSAFPWIVFEGRWGELQSAFFNGPTGPNLKDQWTHPIEWTKTGATRATRCRRVACWGRVRPTCSAPGSSAAPRASPCSCAIRRGCCSCSRRSSASSSLQSSAPPGFRLPRCASHAGAVGGRSSRRRRGCT